MNKSQKDQRGNITSTVATGATLSQIYEEETTKYISDSSKLPDEKTCAKEVVDRINDRIENENAFRPKGNRFRSILDLPTICIVLLIVANTFIALMAKGDRSGQNRKFHASMKERVKLPVAIYQTSGDNKGVWEIATLTGLFGELVERYKPNASDAEKKSIFFSVKNKLPIIRKCVVPYYVPVENGIVNVRTKQLMPFSPNLVFSAKIHTKYDPNAQNPFIYIDEDGSTWDVDSWLNSLGTPEFVMLILEVIQAACTPYAGRGKMCLLFSKQGNNGKGTLSQLLRNLVGETAVVSIPLNEFSKEFRLSQLPDAMAIIVDENDVGSYISGLANLKAIITGDVVTINEKYQPSYDYAFDGLVLQCVNDLPVVNDKTNSFYRRVHIIPFSKCFTGCQRRYIKDRLIYREDVLEYVLKKVLYDMPYRDSFSETQLTKNALANYIKVTNSVVAFLLEILPMCKWNLVPGTEFLYEAYKVWYRQFSPSGKIIGRNDFLDSVRAHIATDPDASQVWEWTDSTRSNGYIDCSVPEPLIDEYNLMAFTDDRFSQGDVRREFPCQSKIKEKYSGLKRRASTIVANTPVQATPTASTTTPSATSPSATSPSATSPNVTSPDRNPA